MFKEGLKTILSGLMSLCVIFNERIRSKDFFNSSYILSIFSWSFYFCWYDLSSIPFYIQNIINFSWQIISNPYGKIFILGAVSIEEQNFVIAYYLRVFFTIFNLLF